MSKSFKITCLIFLILITLLSNNCQKQFTKDRETVGAATPYESAESIDNSISAKTPITNPTSTMVPATAGPTSVKKETPDIKKDPFLSPPVLRPSPSPSPFPAFLQNITSTRPFWDQKFYDRRVGEVMWQKYEWENNFGKEQAKDMIVDWLTGKIPSGLLSAPPIPEEIIGATKENSFIRIYFASGYTVTLEDPDKAMKPPQEITKTPTPENNLFIPQNLPFPEFLKTKFQQNKKYSLEAKSNFPIQEILLYLPALRHRSLLSQRPVSSMIEALYIQ